MRTACCSRSCCSARCRTRASAASMRAQRWRCPAWWRSSPARMFRSRSSRMQLGEAAAQRANTLPEVALATEPIYQGEPIVAVAAIDEVTAADAIEKIKVEYEPLPFVVDPIVTLRPGGPNPRAEGNVWRPPQVQEMKISEAEVAELDAGRVPLLENTPIRLGGRRRRRRLQERRLHSRRDDRAPVHRPSADGAAHGDGVLAERQAVPARVDAVGRAHGRQRRAVGRHPAGSGRRHQRVHRRRVRRQDSRRADDGDSGDSVEEDRPSGDDAHHARGRELHRPRARGHPPAREDRLPQGRPHYGDGPVRHRRLRAVLESGRRRARWARTRRRSTTPKAFDSAASPCSPTRRRACRSARPAASRPRRCSSR